jgi:8-oxo-dGTP pyrophosphatase MutT (NUDIX family)
MSSTKFREALANADDLPSRLAHALARKPAAIGTSLRMSPELSYGRHAGPPPATACRAAVMLLLFRYMHRWHIPLTQRPTALLRHGGQVSLPGGRIEPGETSAAAACRELTEELGITDTIQLIGPMPDRYVYASDYIVTPHIAIVKGRPAWTPDPREVERVVEMPLEHLLRPTSVGNMTIQRGPLTFHAPCFMLDDERIWGVTAVVLGDLRDVLNSFVLPADRHN